MAGEFDPDKFLRDRGIVPKRAAKPKSEQEPAPEFEDEHKPEPGPPHKESPEHKRKTRRK